MPLECCAPDGLWSRAGVCGADLSSDRGADPVALEAAVPRAHERIGQCLLQQGSAGLCLHNIGWPFSEEEHTVLRECAQLSAMAEPST